MNGKWRTDRSSIITHQVCPRKAWYSRFEGGTGIERIRKNLPLVFGSAFHSGAEYLLKGEVETAVAKARLYLDLAFSVEGVDVELAEVAYAIEEQRAIAEGLIRGWWAKDGERFLNDFEVISVEEEGEAFLADGIVLQFRPDALVRERQTGDLFIVSWKTASTFGPWTMNQCQTDMQSMSEVFGVQNVPHGEHEVDLHFYPNIEGVLYLFAIKGQRKKDDYTGTYRQNSPLAYAWMKKGATEADTEWAWKYAWDTEEINERTGKLKGTKLGQGWRLVPVWQEYQGGVKQWIEDLAAQRIAPRHINALEAVFPQSLPVSRRADEIESWRRQVVAQEQRAQKSVEVMKFSGEVGNDAGLRDKLLDVHFPQATHSCFSYNSKCPYYECCWTPAVKTDPLGSGLFKIREPNHPVKESSDE